MLPYRDSGRAAFAAMEKSLLRRFIHAKSCDRKCARTYRPRGATVKLSL
jgi:hypothetical protein